VPDQPLARSELTSVTLGPDEAAQVIQLLHDQRENDAIQFYQAKTGRSLDEARDAISAIEAGLRDVSAPLPLAGRPSLPDPASMPDVVRLAQNGDAIGAINAYRAATGVGLREAKGRIEGLDNRLRLQREAANPSPSLAPVPVARRRSGSLGCTIGCLGVLALFACILGGCSVYVQSQAVYQCSLRAIKTTLAQQEIFAPPINGGYLVVVGKFDENPGRSWSMDADYYAPVWGSNGWGLVGAHVTADSRGRDTMSATLYKNGHSQVLVPSGKIQCPQ